MSSVETPLVAVIMGSKSDWEGTMKAASDTLTDFGVAHESRVLSAHRTPKELTKFLGDVESRGCEVFIAGAGGAAHLAGAVAAQTVRPVLGIPVESKLQGLDSLLSTVQMPSGIPVGTLAVGKSGLRGMSEAVGIKLGSFRVSMALTASFKSLEMEKNLDSCNGTE